MENDWGDSSSGGSTCKVNVEELIIATRQYEELRKTRPFYMNTCIRGLPFNPEILPAGATGLWVKHHHGGLDLRGKPTRKTTYTTSCPNRNAQLNMVCTFRSIRLCGIPGLPYSCVVMEFVTGTPTSSIMKPTLWPREISESDKEETIRPFKERAVDALCFPLSLEPHPDTAPGPVNGGRMKNFVFGWDDSDAPCDVDTLEELQEWINEENEKVCLHG
ncbi:hypothetical protein diail_4688 [Diaporthe ilicicola]|nr:hypothetical protein diail_4688 [Diaporthe ilicicola]